MSVFHESAVIDAMGFMPLDLVDVHVGRLTAKFYPKIEPAMKIWERAYTYQITKTFINAFGAQLNANSTTEGIVSDFKRYFNDQWMSFNNLTILYFHDAASAIINDTTTPGNSQILLPVQDGNLLNCRSQGLKFVCVQCILDFASLLTAAPYSISTTL